MKKIAQLLFFVLAFMPLSAEERLSFLHTEGIHIVDESGRTVVLRGINFGGWLAEELWMLPFKETPPEGSNFLPIKDHVSLWRAVEKRFGKPEMEKMRTHFRNIFFQEADFARIAASGFNCVRLPFFFDVMEESTGLFIWLDKAVEAANRYGLYLILDLHGAPGRQNREHHSGEEEVSRLFQDHTFVQKTCALWAQIAERYKERSVIAGYDLLNEPMGASNSTTLYLVQDQIYRAIRAHDNKHLIFIEDGFKGFGSMPNPQIAGWKNVVFSSHTYPHADNLENELQELIEKILVIRSTYVVPFYLGEFNVRPNCSAEMIKKCIQTFQEKGISWSFWTYKIAGKKSHNSMWALYNRPKDLKKIDLFQESRKTIYRKLALLRTDHLTENNELIEVFPLNP